MITHDIKLDMFPGAVPAVVYLSQYDDDFALNFELYSSRGTFTVESGTTAAIRGTKSDGNGYSVAATISGNTVTVAGDKQMTACAGDQTFELVLTKGTKELCTSNFILAVERAALDADTITSESKIKELVDVLQQADEIMAAAETVEGAMSGLTFTDSGNGNIVIQMGGAS